MKIFYNLYLAYMAFIHEALIDRNIKASLSNVLSILLITFIIHIQLLIAIFTIKQILGTSLHYLLIPVSFIFLFILNYIHLNDFTVNFQAKCAFGNFDEEDKLVMSVYLRALLILDIIILYILV
jgi:hypothetical protein